MGKKTNNKSVSNRTTSSKTKFRLSINDYGERRDRLDHALSSSYNHCREAFPEHADFYLRQERIKPTGKWRAEGFENYVDPYAKDRPVSVDKKNANLYAKRTESVFERLNGNRTISSTVKSRFSKNDDSERRDRLDYALSSSYNHCKEAFPEHPDFYLRQETKTKGKWGAEGFEKYVEPYVRDYSEFPITYGGLTERKSPHSMKLIDFEHHSATCAPGYSRNPFGGPFSY